MIGLVGAGDVRASVGVVGDVMALVPVLVLLVWVLVLLTWLLMLLVLLVLMLVLLLVWVGVSGVSVVGLNVVGEGFGAISVGIDVGVSSP